MKTLYAGPWIGEFGWELMWFNPVVRAAARDHDRVVVASHAGSEYLYEFADEFIPLDAVGHAMHTGKLLSPRPAPVVECDTHVPPTVVRAKERVNREREFRRLGEGNDPEHSVMYAFRPPKSPKGKNPMRKAYPPDRCERLVSMLLEMHDPSRPPGGLGNPPLCVGSYGGADNWHFGGTDLRGRSLELQCRCLSHTKVAIGPSSGTMHLASLCGTPHVTWCDHANVRKRYEVNWNPFGTPVRYLKGVPSPEEVVDAAKEIMR